MRRKIVFDVDDILWDLNHYICNRYEIDINKIRNFNISKCTELTASEQDILYSAYSDPSNFKLPFNTGAEELKTLDGDVHIVSNALNDRVAMYKFYRLQDLGISSDRIHINVINKGSIESKKLPDDLFAFVDDSPYNIISSDAEYNCMIRYPWNTSEIGVATVSGVSNVIYFDTLKQVIDFLKEV